jgi:hypothetical protein
VKKVTVRMFRSRWGSWIELDGDSGDSRNTLEQQSATGDACNHFPEYGREVSQQFRIVDIHGVVAANG